MNFKDAISKYINFGAYVRSQSTLFKAEMKCRCGSWVSGTLTVTKQSVVLEKNFKDGTTLKQEWPAPEAEEGWMEFTLQLGNKLQLSDTWNLQWIPKDAFLECQVDKVDISGGMLIAQCPTGTPTWEVKQGRCADVPIPSTDLAWTKKFSVSSHTRVSPRFVIGGTEVTLQWTNSGITASGDDVAGLPPAKQHILLLTSPGRQNILKVT